MIQWHGFITRLPRDVRIFCAAFIIVLSVGFYTGLLFVAQTESLTPAGVEENYMGNEEDTEAAVMKFKKSPREMLTIIHTHILSMSLIFFLLGLFVWGTTVSRGLKQFLTIEPFVSVVFTFGGIYLMWLGWTWLKYLVVLSGIAMTLTFAVASILVIYQLLVQRPITPDR